MRCRKRQFTVLEMLVVIALILLTTGAIGINIYQAVHEQRFNTELDILVNQLRVAQDLMLVMRADIEVNLTRDANGVYHSALKAKSPIPPFSRRLLKKAEYTYSAIKLVEFDKNGEAQNFPVSIKFFANGFAMSQGILRIGNDPEKPPQELIVLSGYPQPMQTVPAEDYKPLDQRADHELYERLTTYILTETKTL